MIDKVSQDRQEKIMDPEFTIEEMPDQHALEIESQISIFKIAKTLGDSFQKIGALIEEAGAEPSGMPYARYLDIQWDKVRTQGALAQMWMLLTCKVKLRAGIMVSSEVAGRGEIEPVTLKHGRVVKTIHTGPYQKVGAVYKALANWAAENNETLADVSMENYINDPTLVKPEEIQTLIIVSTRQAGQDSENQ
jgi:effector-binding domain-containing protein